MYAEPTAQRGSSPRCPGTAEQEGECGEQELRFSIPSSPIPLHFLASVGEALPTPFRV